MIWWFLILGVSTLVVLFVAIAIYMRVRRHMQDARAAHEALETERREGTSGGS